MKLYIAFLVLIFSSFSNANTCISEQPLAKEAYLIGYLSLENGKDKTAEFDLQGGNVNVRPMGTYLELLNTKVENGRDLVVVLWENNKKSRYLLSTGLKRSSKEHGGISTHDSIDINWVASKNQWPDIYLTQTSLPSKNDRPFMPGPPLYFRYQYQSDTQCYQRTTL